MIHSIGVENDNINSTMSLPNLKKDKVNFRGVGALNLLQWCEKNPMINVAVIDMLSAILPRTIVESMTNWFAGFEAFRRESSGLLVNCMLPGIISIGVAKCLNNTVMPKGSNMSRCLADSNLVDNLATLYDKSSGDKTRDVLKELFDNIEGCDGTESKKISELLTEGERSEYIDKFKELSKKDLSQRQIRKQINELADEIASKTHRYEKLSVTNKVGTVKASNLSTLMQDTVKYLHEYDKALKTNKNITMEEFAKQSKKLIKAKSLGAFAIVLPLAASMQYINRWITEKVSGTEGAPIYDDFGKNKDAVKDEKAKEGLLKQKIISISSMLGVALLSMMKMPTMSMLEFKGIFPTMDQARIISATTFASRMAAAEDKNELREATVRDIVTFSSLYFLGDYAAKITATLLQKKKGVRLLNDTKPLDKNAGTWEKIKHWFKDVNVKTSEEVVSNTAEKLTVAAKAKGEIFKPTIEQAKIIEKELKQARNLRSWCQPANMGVSLLILGIIVPIFTRRNTKKKHAEAIAKAQQQEQLAIVQKQTINSVAN